MLAILMDKLVIFALKTVVDNITHYQANIIEIHFLMEGTSSLLFLL